MLMKEQLAFTSQAKLMKRLLCLRFYFPKVSLTQQKTGHTNKYITDKIAVLFIYHNSQDIGS